MDKTESILENIIGKVKSIGTVETMYIAFRSWMIYYNIFYAAQLKQYLMKDYGNAGKVHRTHHAALDPHCHK